MAINDRYLKLGSQGEDVSDLQTVLGVNPTGTYDRTTADAVTRYQQDNGLTVDGVVGDETLDSLLGSSSDAGAASVVGSGAVSGASGTSGVSGTTSVQNASGASDTSTAADAGASGAAPSPFDMGAVNLPGISDATRQALSDLVSNGYTPSQAVDAALKELNDVIENKPGEFTSKWSDQIDAIMDQIQNREDFTYDFASDPTYQIYKDQYQRQGRMAMMDTMGQAAALTGGYGSSYASTAGNQAYQNYLANLNGIVPELQAQALSAYQLEGDRLNNAYALMNSERTQEQSKWQQAYDTWAADRAYTQSAYDAAKQYDYSDYASRLSYLQNLAAQENTQYNTDTQADRQYAYQTAIKLLNRGKMPSNALLAAAGLSKADAKNLRK